MAQRRFAPLILLVIAGALVLGARLFEVQVLDHALWANEAANLVRSGAIVPYRRGEILDRKGRVLVRDEEVYRVEFVYRDFRRGHPLGQVAHAWSSLTGEPVSIVEAFANLRPWTRELVGLTHDELDEFARGGALRREHLDLPATAEPGLQRRRGRAADVRFYQTQLLDLDRRQVRESRKQRAQLPSLLDYAAELRRGGDVELLLAELDAGLIGRIEDLRRLAALLYDEVAGKDHVEDMPGDDLANLVRALELWRRDLEDDTAGELFREAAGFAPGRLAAGSLAGHVDYGWLATLLRWDEARAAEWLAGARADYERSVEDWYLPRLELEIELGSGELPRPERVLREWAAMFADFEPRRRGETVVPTWQGVERLQVFAELDALFDLEVPREQRALRQAVLPIQVRAAGADGRLATWEDVARLELWPLNGEAGGEGDSVLGPAPDEVDVRARAALWAERTQGKGARAWMRERHKALVARWEEAFQRGLRRHLDRLLVLADEQGWERLPLAEGRLDRAEERARFVLKDRGSRPFELAQRPDYALVYLLTRYPEDFAGFTVRDSHERANLKDEGGQPVLRRLVGNVRSPDLRELMAQRERSSRLSDLRRKGQRSRLETERLTNLVRDVDRIDEVRGGDGLEGHFDTELRGLNGYRERRGMQDLVEKGRRGLVVDMMPVDGEPLTLTLDLELQQAALEVLAHPDGDEDPSECDYTWLARPTGAIVLMTVEGDLLVAASFPDFERGEAMRDQALERTLRMPGFQPAGSVFKPFVAAWALDRLGLDPGEEHGCYELADGHAGYMDVHCWRKYGHGYQDLHQALKHSCNSYFSWLGEQYEQGELVEMLHEFGFGRPSGVRVFPERSGLREDLGTHMRLLNKRLEPREMRMAGNGLGVIEVTPVQMARATAGLATGLLPEARLAAAVGEDVIPRRSRPLAITRASLERVRAAMVDVAGSLGGTAYDALNENEIGVRMAAKTGSADLTQKAQMSPDGKLRVRKHTWVTGWFPAERPAAVLVIFVQDTLQTSSHTAIWVARQFLRRPEVERYIEELEVSR